VLVAGGEGFEAEEQAEWKLPTPKKQPGETALGSDRIRLSAAADEPLQPQCRFILCCTCPSSLARVVPNCYYAGSWALASGHLVNCSLLRLACDRFQGLVSSSSKHNYHRHYTNWLKGIDLIMCASRIFFSLLLSYRLSQALVFSANLANHEPNLARFGHSVDINVTHSL
jgi:hypothetical protein